MRVQSVKDNLKDYMAATALGVVGGYSMKHYLPLSEYERGEVFTPSVLKTLEETEKNARKLEYDSILVGVKEGSEDIAPEVLDVFKANKDNILQNQKQELSKNLQTYGEKIQEGVVKLAKRVKQSGVDAKEVEAKTYEALAKNSRPTSYFILVSTAVLLSFAVLKNSLYKNMNTPSDNKSLDYKA